MDLPVIKSYPEGRDGVKNGLCLLRLAGDDVPREYVSDK